jgi:beta-glucosidase
MLDPPNTVPYDRITASTLQSAPHMKIARDTALASMTLLKNKGAKTAKALPLDPKSFTEPGSLALIGPQAMMAGLLMGNYAESAAAGNWGDTILHAVMERLDHDVGLRAVAYAAGCQDIDCGNTDGFHQALAVASKAQTIVVLLGLGANHIGGHPPGWNEEAWTPGPGGESFEGEGHDRSAIELPGNQSALVASLRDANPTKTIVGVLIHGGTLALGAAGEQLDGILSAW